MPDNPVVEPGYFHRLGIAAMAGDGVGPWLIRTLGARSAAAGMRQVHGMPMDQVPGSGSPESAADTEILWLGRLPAAVFTPHDGTGPLARYIARHGTGLHSVAWTVADLWRTETVLPGFRGRSACWSAIRCDSAGQRCTQHERGSSAYQLRDAPIPDHDDLLVVAQ